jgi:hypothetical protein
LAVVAASHWPDWARLEVLIRLACWKLASAQSGQRLARYRAA